MYIYFGNENLSKKVKYNCQLSHLQVSISPACVSMEAGQIINSQFLCTFTLVMKI